SLLPRRPQKTQGAAPLTGGTMPDGSAPLKRLLALSHRPSSHERPPCSRRPEDEAKPNPHPPKVEAVQTHRVQSHRHAYNEDHEPAHRNRGYARSRWPESLFRKTLLVAGPVAPRLRDIQILDRNARSEERRVGKES